MPSLGTVAKFLLVAYFVWLAFDLRLWAIRTYGKVIHEFDPWFNFRATEYLVDNGWAKFSTWYDDMSWYPLGRPVGTTIYPGLMVTSAAIFHSLNAIGIEVSINDVCVYIPAVFGSLTSMLTMGLAYEVSGSSTAAIASLGVMAIIPAHLMRSVGGGYDNESVAVAAIVGTFYLFARSLREGASAMWGVLTGLCYVYAVSAWGAYTFPLNMIGLSVFVALVAGHFSWKLYKAYSLFYVIGTLGAIQFPIVGMAPFRSMEQVMPLLVFFGLQLWAFVELSRPSLSDREFERYRQKVFGFAALAGAMAVFFLISAGYLGSFSSRVMALFVPHTRTGNPLVDSVSEHQATNPKQFWYFFHFTTYVAPIGFISLFFNINDVRIFAIVLSIFSYYFSQKMTRLVLLLSPSAAVLSGIIISGVLEWAWGQFFSEEETPTPISTDEDKKEEETPKKKKKEKKKKDVNPLEIFNINNLPASGRKLVAMLAVVVLVLSVWVFFMHCLTMAEHLSEPQVVVSARDRDGSRIIIDDYREAYWWLRDNTPEDSRVLAWWDYGYQINGIAKRTTIADGNTWNFEHIALLAKTLISSEEVAYNNARHLADYVLVLTSRFAGLYSDDLAKMPQLALIAGNVYPEIQYDVDRQGFFTDREGNATPAAKRSLIYKLTYFGRNDDIQLKHFEEVYTSKYSMVRIYKVINPAKRTPFGEYAPELKLGQFKKA
eukprot:TRINITY_DN102_c0_g1_i1.p1 TRINITY_DN102_c0_g1~~TRINITY_DN102_c0_g1_i1.p1  ORF type:complete len:723 (+),score=207.17 TRINITY_DN102_c0_g1_i1:32-2170(+)